MPRAGRGDGTDNSQRNRLLALLPEADFRRLSAHFERVSLAPRQVLFEPDQPILYLHFPHNGTVVSLVTPMQDGSGVEAVNVGSEGFVGLDAYLDGGQIHYRAICQAPGEADRIEAAPFRREAARSDALRTVVHRYIMAMIVQLTQASACNRRHSVEQRGARWLLTTGDRVRSDTFALTHEMLAEMLGVRRASVTVVARALQDAGLIRYGRGTVTVLDRRRLEQASCECYGVIKREVERLLGAGHAGGKP